MKGREICTRELPCHMIEFKTRSFSDASCIHTHHVVFCEGTLH